MALGINDTLGTPRVPKSFIHVTEGLGHGSSGDRVVRYTTLKTLEGGCVTWVQNSVDGDAFVINYEGYYSVTLNQGSSAAAEHFGVVQNPSALGTGVLTQPADKVLCLSYSAATNSVACSSRTIYLRQGTILRVMSNGGNTPWNNVNNGIIITWLGGT